MSKKAQFWPKVVPKNAILRALIKELMQYD